MTTEASYRFERSADIEMASFACDRAAAYDSRACRRRSAERNHRRVSRKDRTGSHQRCAVIALPRFSGHRSKTRSSIRFLNAWNSNPRKQRRVDRRGSHFSRGSVRRRTLCWRKSHGTMGLINFPGTLALVPGFRCAASGGKQDTPDAQQVLSASGYSEIYTYSFSNEEMERRFYPDIEPVRLRNPLSEEATILRTSLIPGNADDAAVESQSRQRNLQIVRIEQGLLEWRGAPYLILGACGNTCPDSVHEGTREFDFFTLKGDVEELLEGFNTPMRLTTDNIPKYYHPGRFARVGHLAMFGELASLRMPSLSSSGRGSIWRRSTSSCCWVLGEPPSRADSKISRGQARLFTALRQGDPICRCPSHNC